MQRKCWLIMDQEVSKHTVDLQINVPSSVQAYFCSSHVRWLPYICVISLSNLQNLAANKAKPRHQFNFGHRRIGKYLKFEGVRFSFVVKLNMLSYSATLQRKPRDSSLSRLFKTRITLMTEQSIDVQGHSKSSTFVAIESPHMTSYQ